MNITINTDASFCPKTKVGGYAFWITSDLGRIKHSNIFNGVLNNPSEAEMKCIINAVYFLSKKIDIANHNIIVNTDCTSAIKALRIRFPKISFRHVKGHQKGSLDKRSFVNNWCDAAAKERLRQARNGITPKYKELEWK